MTKLITRKTAIAAIISLTVAYPAYAAVPNTFVAGQPASAAEVNANFTDLDTRVGALESAAAEPAVSVAINCGADANALKNADIREHTTYNITGVCNGPIYVDKDGVHLTGSDNLNDSIVMPTGLDSQGVVSAGGAHDLRITNLFLDLRATTAADGASGISARSSFVRLQDSRIEGGSSGVNPYRGSIVQLNGANSITEFINSGLSASDQSNINTRGPTVVSSTRTDDQYMKGIRASNGSSIHIGSGITVSMPTSTDARAINAESNASVHIQNSGTVSLTGDIRGDQNSNIRIEKGTINGDFDISRSATLMMRNGVTINGDVDVGYSAHWRMDGGSISGTIEAYRGGVIKLEDVTQTSTANNAVNINENSVLSADNSNLGRFSVFANSTINLKTDSGSASTVKGGEMNLGSVGTIRGVTVTADIALFPSSVIHITNGSDLDGNNLYLCDSGFSSYVDSSVTGIANSTTTSNCRP